MNTPNGSCYLRQREQPQAGGTGFHDLKFGVNPALKWFTEGFLVEDAPGARCAGQASAQASAPGQPGLSQWYCENWADVGNLRKNTTRIV